MKHTYRVKNWKQYNQSLINRGNLTIWLDEETLKKWHSPVNSPGRGRPRCYSDQAIEAGLIVRSLFQFPLRQVQGFLEGLFYMLDLDIKAPNYSTLCRRSSKLDVSLKHIKSHEPIHLLIDTTGLKVYGEGEWHIRVHGKSKRRTWRKFHAAIDHKTLEITAASLTPSTTHDSLETKGLIKNTAGEIATVTGDKAYDNRHAYNAIGEAGAWSRIPPRSGAALGKGGAIATLLRSLNVRNCWILGRKQWKKEVGYHDRSLVENAFYRYKTILGPRLRSRTFRRQVVEMRIDAQILNRMTHLGMPKTQRI